ncbi:MAG: hypothetical protein WAV20_21390 [Blastocatellia bacterium]
MLLSFDNFAGNAVEDLGNPVFSIAMTSNARLAVVGRARSPISVWDVRSGEMLDSSYDSISAIAVAVTPDQRRMVCRSRLGGDGALSLQVWEIKMAIGRPFLRLATLRRNLSPSMGLALSPDGRLAAWGEGSTLHIRDLETSECHQTLRGSSGEIQSLKFSPDGCLVALAGSEGLEVWDVNRGSLQFECSDSLEPHALGLMPDGRWLVVAGEDGSISVFDARNGTRIRTWRAHEPGLNVIAVSSDCRKVASGSLTDRSIGVWDVESSQCITKAELPFGVIALDLKRSLLAVGDRGGNVLFSYVRQLTGTPVVTPVRLWKFGQWSLYRPTEDGPYERRQVQPGVWSDELTVFCDWCGERPVPPSSVLEAIRGIAKDARLEPGDSPCLKLPDEAWNEPRLLSHCSVCHESLKYNPFVVVSAKTGE